MEIVNVTSKTYEKEVLQEERLVILDFWAEWCGPCRLQSAVMDTLAKELEEVKLCKINIEEEPKLTTSYGILSIPSIFLIKDGTVLKHMIGLHTKKELMEIIDNLQESDDLEEEEEKQEI